MAMGSGSVDARQPHTDPEIQRIERELREAGWATQTTLERELRVWANLAARVNAHTFSIDDDTNDLCPRDYLAEFGARASGDLKDCLRDVIARSDDEFLRATVADTRGLVGRYYRIQGTATGGGGVERQPPGRWPRTSRTAKAEQETRADRPQA